MINRPSDLQDAQDLTAGRAKEFVSLTLVLKATIHGSRGDPPHHAD
jgi:hypothetical protein